MDKLVNRVATVFGVFAMALGLVLVVVKSVSSLNASQETKVIDAHVHVNFDGKDDLSSNLKHTEEEFKREAALAGLVGYVAHTRGANAETPKIGDLKGVYCIGVAEKVDLKGIEKALTSKQFNCIKIYLGYIHRFAYSEEYRGVYKLADKLHVPVVFHTGDTYDKMGKVKYSDPLTIDEVAVDFRNVNFVIAHAGNPWFQSAAEVAYKNDNVFMDASALWVGEMSKFEEESRKLLVIDPLHWIFSYMENADKMMFGSDWPLVDLSEYKKMVLKAIPTKHHEKFLYKNAAKVFSFQ